MPIRTYDPLRPVKGRLKTDIKQRQTKDENGLNKMEAEWYEVLKSRDFEFLEPQPFGLKLGDNCRYHPDFIALKNGELVAFETKGFMRDDALVKLKAAARKFTFIRFVLVTKVEKRWVETDIEP